MLYFKIKGYKRGCFRRKKTSPSLNAPRGRKIPTVRGLPRRTTKKFLQCGQFSEVHGRGLVSVVVEICAAGEGTIVMRALAEFSAGL